MHHNFDDSDSGYDVDLDSKSKIFSGTSRGRIILLGDGTEVLTSAAGAEMFDQSDEDNDLESQVQKGQVAANQHSENSATKTPAKTDSTEPKYKGVSDTGDTKSTDSTSKKVEEKPESA